MQPTRPNFSSTELVDMISRGGVNRLHRSTSLLASDIREFRKDRNLAQLLSGLDEILQGGKMLEREDEEWLIQNRLPLTVSESKDHDLQFTYGCVVDCIWHHRSSHDTKFKPKHRLSVIIKAFGWRRCYIRSIFFRFSHFPNLSERKHPCS